MYDSMSVCVDVKKHFSRNGIMPYYHLNEYICSNIINPLQNVLSTSTHFYCMQTAPVLHEHDVLEEKHDADYRLKKKTATHIAFSLLA